MQSILRVISVVVIIVMICTTNVNGFNVSPVPNRIIREPNANNNSNSYFGFSVNLKPKGIFVGAPRARLNSSNENELIESGAIYECDLKGPSNDNCQSFNGLGSLENSNGSWLGMSMDSGTLDNEAFVVCAPRFTTYCEGRISRDVKYYREKRNKTYRYDKIPYETYDKGIHGNCYWTKNNHQNGMQIVVNLKMDQLLSDSDKNEVLNEKTLKYYDGEHGFSVHITDDNSEILMGVPGSAYSRGSIIRKKLNTSHVSSELIDSEVPDPRFWDDDRLRVKNTYFGFSISSGYFYGPTKSKLLYVAGAPRETDETGANNGSVYIFDFQTQYYTNQSYNETRMKKIKKFDGECLGEYFGYSVLVEDFDSDGFMDIAIGAPYRSSGVVYVYKNLKTDPLNFTLHSVLNKNDKNYSGDFMFGANLMKVGDINQDGYNDLVVSAPFEGNGSIYIYHGSKDGLLDTPVQKIIAPNNELKKDLMFGYGLSKGVDLDGNNYVDFAVGAPNAEAVYIYKTYPVIQIRATIEPVNKKIPITAESFEVKACFHYESKHNINFDIRLIGVVKLIDNFGRVKFQDHKCNGKECEFEISLESNAKSKCVSRKASVNFLRQYIYEPIYMELDYSVNNTIPQYDNITDHAHAFCEKCVALDPKSETKTSNSTKFDPGCKLERCEPDLRINSQLSYNGTECNGRRSFKRGDFSLTVDYSIKNHDEPAYSANIYITLPENVQFQKIPSECQKVILQELASNKSMYNCSLTRESPMYRGNETTLSLSIDTRSLMTIQTIEIEAKTSSYQTASGHPIFDKKEPLLDLVPVTDYSDIEIFGSSANSDMKLRTDFKTLENLSHKFEIKNLGPSIITSLNVFVYLPIQYIDPITKSVEELIDIKKVSVYREGQKTDVKWLKHEANGSDSIVALGTAASKNDSALSQLSEVQTTYFDCSEPGYERCFKGHFTISNVSVSASLPITVTFPIYTKKLIDASSAYQEYFVVFSSIAVQKSNEDNCFSVKVDSYPYTKFSRKLEKFTPLWIYVVSCVFGTLILELISLAMYKIGFFRRSKHEELKQLKRASPAATASTSQQINQSPKDDRFDLDSSGDEKEKLI